MTSYAELHRHLDGSLRPSSLIELAAQQHINVPDSLRFYNGMGLQKALDCFRVTLAVLQQPDAVRRIAKEMCEDAQREGTTALEIRFAPHLHIGADVNTIVDAAIDGIQTTPNVHAGLILCGLYNDPPKYFENLVDLAASRPLVVGIDLAGGPGPKDTWGMVDYAPAFKRARDLGIGRTVHAGEGRPPEEIRTAISALHANRIGHGTTLLDDTSVLELVLNREITIEACPSSNLHTGAINDANAHPLPRWLKYGVKACICTDNTLFSEVDAPEEHRRASKIPGMTKELIQLAIGYGHSGLFKIR